MSLNWNLSRIKDKQSLRTPNGELAPVTYALVWATMVIGYGQITAKNAADFYRRVHLYESLFGTFMLDTDNNNAPVFLTLADVERHIGLHTNVANESRAVWLRRVWNMTEEWTRKARKGVTPLPVEA